MKRKLIILKLGGSIITKKSSNKPILQKKVLFSLVNEITKLFQTGKYQFIIVHGGGSFAHPVAKKYNLDQGFSSNTQKYGFSITSQKMIELNLLILNSLTRQGLPVVSLSPHSFIKQSNKKIFNFDLKIIEKFLLNRFIPVLYGDVVLDDKQGCSILSGDVIIAKLSQFLTPDRIIFLTDVDGIFDKNPKIYGDAVLIPDINNKNYKSVIKSFTISNNQDVTGEIQGKLNSIKNLLPKVEVFILNGAKPRNLTKLLDGHKMGTRLCFD